MTDALRERGYLNADGDAGVQVEHSPERATLVFTIDPGPRTMIGTIERDGHAGGAARRSCCAQLGLATGAPYEREALNARIEKYLVGRPQPRLLRGEGHAGGQPRRRRSRRRT